MTSAPCRVHHVARQFPRMPSVAVIVAGAVCLADRPKPLEVCTQCGRVRDLRMRPNRPQQSWRAPGDDFAQLVSWDARVAEAEAALDSADPAGAHASVAVPASS